MMRVATFRTGAARGLLVAAALSLASLPSLAAAQQAIGINAAVRNRVEIQRGAAPPRRAVLRQRVALADQVRTGAASQLQILLLDRSTFTVGSNARLTIDRFVYDPRRSVRSMGATVTRGAFRFMSGRSLSSSSSRSSVRTPVATIGIRGTILAGAVGTDAVRIAAGEEAVGAAIGGDPEAATLIVLRGPGPQTQGGSQPGAADITAGDNSFVLDRPRLALYVPGPGMAPIGPFVMSDAGLLALEQLLRPVPSAEALAVGPLLGDFAGDFGDPGSPPGAGQPDAGAEPQAEGKGFFRQLGSWMPPLIVALGGAFALAFNGSDRPVSP